MLKQRRDANDAVTRDFLQAEAAADLAATRAAQCVATMLQARVDANLPVGTGLDALRLVAEGTNALIRARQSFVEAHQMLIDVRSDIGLTAWFGDEAKCPPTQGSAEPADPSLRLVAAA